MTDRPIDRLPDRVADRLSRFHIETPSWGYADTGTRFGKFPQDAAAITFDDKLDDAAHVHRLTGCCPTVAVHVLWDFELDGVAPQTAAAAAKQAAESRGVRIGSINPNLFQDAEYKLGSLCNADAEVRQRAMDHVRLSIELGRHTGSDLLSLWLADGTNYPGQGSFTQRKRWLSEGLRALHGDMPDGMTMLIEYKPFEPAFYHTDIADWGMARAYAEAAGPRAKVLVDTGHHLPATNIEHIVAFLIDDGLLGGFHFNDSKYADDDVTMGSIDPYQLFRIFVEIVSAEHARGTDLDIAYMIDQSHNLKPKIAATLQTVDTAQANFAKALTVDQDALASARASGDIIAAEGVLRDAFEQDIRPALRAWRASQGLPPDPLREHRESGYEAKAAADRAPRKPGGASSYA